MNTLNYLNQCKVSYENYGVLAELELFNDDFSFELVCKDQSRLWSMVEFDDDNFDFLFENSIYEMSQQDKDEAYNYLKKLWLEKYDDYLDYKELKHIDEFYRNANKHESLN